jgi:hypothetical protein
MKYDRMEEIIATVQEDIAELRRTKGREYAQDEDTLADFKEIAVESGTTPLQVWHTYVKKHQRAIDTYIREGSVKSEAIASRVIDVITYHYLLLGLIEDLKNETVKPVANGEAPPPLQGSLVTVSARNGATLIGVVERVTTSTMVVLYETSLIGLGEVRKSRVTIHDWRWTDYARGFVTGDSFEHEEIA